MIIYTSTCVSKSDIADVRARDMGILFAATPSNFLPRKTMDLAGIPIALDNGAFGCYRDGWPAFDEMPFLRLLHADRRSGIKPDWVVCPDLVCGGLASLDFSLSWVTRLSGLKLALAVQNGMEPRHVLPHIEKFAVIFVGGDLPWKWSTAKQWADLAHDHGKKCHIGRAGEVNDLHRAEMLGADSCDSSSIVRNKSWNNVDASRRDEPEPDFLA